MKNDTNTKLGKAAAMIVVSRSFRKQDTSQAPILMTISCIQTTSYRHNLKQQGQQSCRQRGKVEPLPPKLSWAR